MSFSNLRDKRPENYIDLPVGKKVYRVMDPDYSTGLYVQTMLKAQAKSANGEELTDEEKSLVQLNDDEERTLMQGLLGDAYGHMITDKVSWPDMQLINQTVLIWVASGRAVAEQFWNSGGDPKASPKVSQAAAQAESAVEQRMAELSSAPALSATVDMTKLPGFGNATKKSALGLPMESAGDSYSTTSL